MYAGVEPSAGTMTDPCSRKNGSGYHMAAIGELSTYMAHEIRNPVFSIGGFANSLLRNPSLDDAARAAIRKFEPRW